MRRTSARGGSRPATGDVRVRDHQESPVRALLGEAPRAGAAQWPGPASGGGVTQLVCSAVCSARVACSMAAVVACVERTGLSIMKSCSVPL